MTSRKLVPDVITPRSNVDSAFSNVIAVNKMMQDAVNRPGDLLGKYLDSEEAKAEKRRLEAKKDDQYNTSLGFKQREEDRLITANKTAQDEKLANREALKAVLNPLGFTNEKLTAEQEAVNQSLAALDPKDRAEAEAALKTNYDKDLSARQWLDVTKGNTNVDQGKLYDAINADYNRKVQTPGTEEYNTRLNAEKEQKLWELDQQAKKQMQVALHAARLNREKPTEVTMSKVFPDGKVQQVKVSSADVGLMKQNGFDLGTFSNVSKDGNGGTSQVKLEGKKSELLAKIAPWNILSGDRDSAMSDYDEAANLLKAKTNMKNSDILNVLNNALVQSTSGDSYDSSRFENAYMSALENIPAKSQPKSGVIESMQKAVEDKPVSTKKDSNVVNKLEALFNVNTPTTYNPVLGTSNTDLSRKDILKINYNRLPEYLKKDVSYSKYKDNPRFYEQFLK